MDLTEEDFEEFPVEIRNTLKHIFLGQSAKQDARRSEFFAELIRLPWTGKVALAEAHFLGEFDESAQVFTALAFANAPPGLLNPQYAHFLDGLSEQLTSNLSTILKNGGALRDESVSRFKADLIVRKLSHLSKAKQLKFDKEANDAQEWKREAQSALLTLQNQKPLRGVAINRVASAPKNQIRKLANDTFCLALNQIHRQYGSPGNYAERQVKATGNSGSYLPALIKWGAERVRDLILAHANAYVEAFTRYRVSSDLEAENDLNNSARQMAAGSISAIRGRLQTSSTRLRRQEGGGVNLSEITRSMDLAVKDGVQLLRKQRLSFSLAPGGTDQVRGAIVKTSTEVKAAKANRNYKTVMGRNIDKLRHECGWSFDELAREAQLDKKLCLGHVNDGKNPYPGTVKKYADAFARALRRPVAVSDLTD